MKLNIITVDGDTIAITIRDEDGSIGDGSDYVDIEVKEKFRHQDHDIYYMYSDKIEKITVVD